MLLHFCLSISIISKISRSQTTCITARPFVSFASAKVGKNHPNFQIRTQIHTATKRFPHQFARVHYCMQPGKGSDISSTPTHLTPHLSEGRSIHREAFIRRSLRTRLCRESCPLFRVLWYRTPSSPICLSEVTEQALRLIARIPLLSSGGKSIVLVKKKAPSHRALPLSMYVVFKTRHVNPKIHVRRY